MNPDQCVEESLVEILENSGLKVQGKCKRGMIPINHLDSVHEGIVPYATGYTAYNTDSYVDLFVRAALAELREGEDSNLRYIIGADFRSHSFPVVQDFIAAFGECGEFFSPTQFGITKQISNEAIKEMRGENQVGYFMVVARNPQEATDYCSKLVQIGKNARQIQKVK